jgi:hypothetical protein
MESIFNKIIDKKFIEQTPLLKNFFFWRWTADPPDIFIIILSWIQFILLNSHTIWIDFGPNSFALTVKHETSINYIESNFFAIVTKSAIKRKYLVFYLWNFNIVADQIFTDAFISPRSNFWLIQEFLEKCLLSYLFLDNVIIGTQIKYIIRKALNEMIGVSPIKPNVNSALVFIIFIYYNLF